jgi:hypothetical protein
MTRRRQAVQVRQDRPFKGRQFTAEVILWAVRWYLMFPISYRDLELMLLLRRIDDSICGQHDALDALVVGIDSRKVNWILDADIRSFCSGRLSGDISLSLPSPKRRCRPLRNRGAFL